MSDQPIIFDKVVSASTSNEYVDPADAARIRLTRKEVERLLHLAEVAKRESVYLLRDTSYAAEFGFFDDDEETFIPTEEAGTRNEDGPLRTECNNAEVVATLRSAWVSWRVIWKHTDIVINTDIVDVRELRAALDADGDDTCPAAASA